MRDRVVLPPHAPGMRIGLFGGTFDPPHEAHRAACLLAMKRLRLDRVWWLVTPGNPLKDTAGLAPLAERVAAARALAHHPRIDVTDLEAEIGTRYTYETDVAICGALPRRALRLDHGRRQSAQLPPLAEMARDRRTGADRGGRSAGPSLYATGSVAAQALARYRHSGSGGDDACAITSRRPGSICTASSRRCRRRRCAPRRALKRR